MWIAGNILFHKEMKFALCFSDYESKPPVIRAKESSLAKPYLGFFYFFVLSLRLWGSVGNKGLDFLPVIVKLFCEF